MTSLQHIGRTGAAVFFTLAIFCTVAAVSVAQEPDIMQSGRLWYLAFPDTVRNAYDSRHPPTQGPEVQEVHIWSSVDQTIRITSEGRDDIVRKVYGGTFEIVRLDIYSDPIVNESYTRHSNIFRLKTEEPVIVYCYMVTRFGAEAWTPIPVEAWGTEYYAATLPAELVEDVVPCNGCENTYDRRKKCAPSQILIMAAYDGTTVAISPNPNPDLLFDADDIHLDAGEVLLVESRCDTAASDQPDLAGTRITASKPIGVISGNTRAGTVEEETGLSQNSFKNMHIEWLSPVSQHGTQFVYMPTWDQYALRSDISQEAVRKYEEVRIYGTSKDQTAIRHFEGGDRVDSSVGNGTYITDRLEGSGARAYITDKPVQMMMNSAPVVIYKGTTGGGEFTGAAYESAASYMTELTPREQWPSFAPFHVPLPFPQMRHYVNVVTDTINRWNVFYTSDGGAPNRPFNFNRGTIDGTDLVWGQMTVNPGQDYVIEGRDGALFFAFAYGIWEGFERFVPGSFDREDRPGIAGSGREAEVHVLHPADYYEEVSVAYGYPLAPRRQILQKGDSLVIDIEREYENYCATMTVTAEPFSTNAAGFRSVVLDPTTIRNATLELLEPSSTEVVGYRKKVVVQVSAVDPSKDASADILFTDRTGRVTRVPFTYTAQKLTLEPSEVAFDGLVVGETSSEFCITITNDFNEDIAVGRISLEETGPDNPFAITGITPELGIGPLKKGEELQVCVTVAPPGADSVYRNTILIQLHCRTVRIPLVAPVGAACLLVEDLDFGTLQLSSKQPEVSRTLDLVLCNAGAVDIAFNEPGSGSDAVTWLQENFEIDRSEVDALRDVLLEPQECHVVQVTFKADRPGVYQTTARFWADTRECRDTSVWTAYVVQAASAPDPGGDGVLESVAVEPNPFSERAVLRIELQQRGTVRIDVYDVAGRQVGVVAEHDLPAGMHALEWDASQQAAGLYYCRVTVDGSTYTIPMVLAR